MVTLSKLFFLNLLKVSMVATVETYLYFPSLVTHQKK